MPSNAIASLNSYLVRANKIDPTLVPFFQELIRELERIERIVDPPPIINTKIASGAAGSVPGSVTSFGYRLTDRNVILEWQPFNDVFTYYELRKGSTWSTATKILTTAERQVYLDPLTVGNHTYLLRSLSVDGVYSESIESTIVVIPALGSIDITSVTVDQNVLLYWTVPTSTFDIKEYALTKDGVEFTRTSSPFAALVELINGTYVYGVKAYDIAGNSSAESIISITVAGPPDFILRDEFISTLTGTKTNAKLQSYNNSLLVPVNTVETWDEHFSTRSWASPQAQVDAGYPRYIQPGTTTASYKETFDVGLIYPASIISITWTLDMIVGTFNIGVSTRVSDDGISWSSAQVGQNIYVESVRYIEVTVNFTGNNDKALAEFYNFHVSLQVKESMDSGEINAISTDVGGTFVNFNIPFKDVSSITVSLESTTGLFTAYYDFDDVPNPTGFSIFVVDSAGARASKLVSWKARGIT